MWPLDNKVIKKYKRLNELKMAKKGNTALKKRLKKINRRIDFIEPPFGKSVKSCFQAIVDQ